MPIGNLLLIAALAALGLLESAILSRRGRVRFGRSLLVFLAHFSPAIVGALLLPSVNENSHQLRILLLLLAVSVCLHAGWFASQRISLKLTRLRYTLAATGLLIVALAYLIELPPWLITAAMLGGLFAISTELHGIVSDRFHSPTPNLVALAAALAFIVLLDAGLAHSFWRWDLRLFGPGPGFTSDAAIRSSMGKPFLPPRDSQGQSIALEPGDGLRILLIGGSSAAGCCTEQRQQTMQGQLELALQERGLDAEVLNGAWDGYVSHYMVLDAIEGYRRLEPDLVLMYLGANDNGLIDTLGERYDEKDYGPALQWLRHRPFYQLLNSLLVKLRRGGRPREPIPAVSEQIFVDNLRTLRRIYGELGAQSLLFIEAIAEPRSLAYEQRVLTATEAAGVEAVDAHRMLRETYTAAGDYMNDDVHPNTLGHWSVAMIMLGELDARGLLPTNADTAGGQR
ncbi:MAG: SGNH/GDSL hydrolase family protein [Candidatus Alcyoniella australis]|nr:SGNH/GDSL hydrolase family protein [Candidatus Alcyoniella australis]